ACTPSCPTNGFPELGGSWQLKVAEVDDQGFFATRSQAGQRVYSGSGTVGSVSYQEGTMTLHLERPGPTGGVLRGVIYVTLPPRYAVALQPGVPVAVKVIDASSPDAYDQRAVTLRGDG